MANSRKKRQATAPSGDAQNSGASTTGATTTTAKAHSFSRAIAEEHGEKAAVLLQYLAHHVSKSKHQHAGRKWFYKTLDDRVASAGVRRPQESASRVSAVFKARRLGASAGH